MAVFGMWLASHQNLIAPLALQFLRGEFLAQFDIRKDFF
jgi:hypothetical protein